MTTTDIKENRQPHAVDVHVGERIRMRRKFVGLSQTDLASKLGITFQQIQKYERGMNRISASKLFEASRALRAPITYFFEGVESRESEAGVSESEEAVHAFLATSEGIDLAEAFPRLKSPKYKRRVLELVKSLADDG